MIIDGCSDEDYEEKLTSIIKADDKNKFVDLLRVHNYGPQSYSDILIHCLGFKAKNCALALVNGELGDVPFVGDDASFLCLDHPFCFPEFVELLLKDCCGSRVVNGDVFGHLPLHHMLYRLRDLNCVSTWSPRQSVVKLIVLLCLPEAKQILDCARLIAEYTEPVDDVALGYIQHNELIELAGLLLVAHQKVVPHIKSDNILLQNAGGATLLKIFEKAGDPLSQYAMSTKGNVSPEEIIAEVAKRIQNDGFELTPKDVKGLSGVCSIDPPVMKSVLQRLGIDTGPKCFFFPPGHAIDESIPRRGACVKPTKMRGINKQKDFPQRCPKPPRREEGRRLYFTACQVPEASGAAKLWNPRNLPNLVNGLKKGLRFLR